MSVEYSLKSMKSWAPEIEKMLEEWGDQNPQFNVYINKSKDSSAYIVFSKGSIRGFTLTFGKKFIYHLLDIKINSCSSSDDWRTLASFIAFISKRRSFSLYEEGYQIKLSDINDKYLQAKIDNEKRVMINLLGKLLDNKEYIKLPLWDVEVVVYNSVFEELKKSDDSGDTISAYLVEKSGRMMRSRRAATITTNNSKEVSVWNYDDMVLYKPHYIAVANPLNGDDILYLPWDEFIHSSYVQFDTIPEEKNRDTYYFIFSIEDKLHMSAFEYFRGVAVDIK